MQTLEVDTEGPIGRLTLNRPRKRNALSPQALEELVEAAGTLDARPEVKVVVVAGAGRAFCAGFDLDTFANAGQDPRETVDLGRRMAEALSNITQVTVAAIHGHCVGGGVVLAAACDLRLADAETVFSIPEVNLGIPLAWGGIPRLVRELGPAVTKELVLTCRAFGAEEARALRFVNRVVPAGGVAAAANELAAELAAKPGHLLRATKERVNTVVENLATTAGSEVDADLLVAAARDAESQQSTRGYLGEHEKRAERSSR